MSKTNIALQFIAFIILGSLITCQTLYAQQVSGTVTNAQTGDPLVGVNILVVGTSTGTATDVDGHYSLSVPSRNDSLRFSYIGFQTKIVPIKGSEIVNISLQPTIYSGQQMVVIGYGQEKKKQITGAISSVSAKELNTTQITSVDQGLAGKASGLLVTTTSGQPGGAVSVQIRGNNSLQSGNQPLYVIDGLPLSTGSGAGPDNKLSPLAALNPATIKSIQILKGPSATAIYGSRGSNGVVLITTKGGKRGKDNITISVNHGFSDLVRKLDVMGAYQYAKLVNAARINDGKDPYYSDSELKRIQQEGGTDWQDVTYRTAPTQNYNINFSGGGKKTTYSLSGNYKNAQGIIRHSYYKRYNAHLSLQRDVTNKFNLSTYLNINRTSSALSQTGGSSYNTSIVYAALRMSPIQPIYQDKNVIPPKYTLTNIPGVEAPNPVATENELINNYKSTRLFGDIYGQYDILPNLSIKAKLGIDLSNGDHNRFVPNYIQQGLNSNSATIVRQNTNMWINENTIRYKDTFNKVHSLKILGGITLQHHTFGGATASSEKFVTNKLKYHSLESAQVYNRPYSSHTEWSYASYYGRIKYNFDERYLFTLTGREDGSSRFGENNKYGFFPSGSFAWHITNEDFMKDVDFLSNLKLRVAYGITGNQEIGLYNSLATLGSVTYTIGNELHTGFYPNKIPDPDLKWEKTKELDIGLNISFLNNRLTITSDYYKKKTTDLLFHKPISWVSGYSTAFQNVGSIENKGFEFSLKSNNFQSREFNWTSNFNITFLSNKVLSLGGIRYRNVGPGSGHLKVYNPHRLQVGKPISVFYGYVFDGIYQSKQEVKEGPAGPTTYLGGRRYKDISGPNGKPDGKITPQYDKTIIGNPSPDFYGGFRNSFSYKGFQLDVFLEFKYGNQIMNYNRFDMELPTGNQNVFATMKNHWSKQNRDENVYPRPTGNRSAVFSTRQIEDGSYLKIKNIMLGYNFPGVVNHSQTIRKLKLFLSVTNYITFTKYDGYDPDISFRGVSNLSMGEDWNQYPMTKTIQIGLSLGL